MARVPQFAVPFAVVDGSPVEIEQDTQQEITQCVRAVLHTTERTLIDNPEFGVPDRAFAQMVPNRDAVVYLNVVERWEPRAQVLGDAFIEGEVERIVIRGKSQ